MLLTYYGLVPREYLNNLKENEDIVELFPENSAADDYTDMVEAIVVIANDGQLLKAEENPYMMKDRPVLSYQDDTVPNRLLGRGTVEKAFNMQFHKKFFESVHMYLKPNGKVVLIENCDGVTEEDIRILSQEHFTVEMVDYSSYGWEGKSTFYTIILNKILTRFLKTLS